MCKACDKHRKWSLRKLFNSYATPCTDEEKKLLAKLK